MSRRFTPGDRNPSVLPLEFLRERGISTVVQLVLNRYMFYATSLLLSYYIHPSLYYYTGLLIMEDVISHYFINMTV